MVLTEAQKQKFLLIGKSNKILTDLVERATISLKQQLKEEKQKAKTPNGVELCEYCNIISMVYLNETSTFSATFNEDYAQKNYKCEICDRTGHIPL